MDTYFLKLPIFKVSRTTTYSTRTDHLVINNLTFDILNRIDPFFFAKGFASQLSDPLAARV